MTKKSCNATVGKLCKKAELSKDECQEISRKLCPRELPELPSLPSIEERDQEETEKEERRELTKKPHPKVISRVVPEFPSMREFPSMPTLAEGLKEPKKKH
jgi:hypothetical protein